MENLMANLYTNNLYAAITACNNENGIVCDSEDDDDRRSWRYWGALTWQRRRSQIAERVAAAWRCLPIEKLKRYRQIDAWGTTVTERISRHGARLSRASLLVVEIPRMYKSSSTLQQVARSSGRDNASSIRCVRRYRPVIPICRYPLDVRMPQYIFLFIHFQRDNDGHSNILPQWLHVDATSKRENGFSIFFLTIWSIEKCNIAHC